jgi:hypothetical protein
MQDCRSIQEHIQNAPSAVRTRQRNVPVPTAMHTNATYNQQASMHDAQQAGFQQQVAEFRRAVQGMHSLLTTRNAGAGTGGGLQL